MNPSVSLTATASRISMSGPLLDFHRSHGKLATMTAVRPPGRFGVLSLEGSRVVRFEEKPQIEQGYINGGFFVLSPKVLERIASDKTCLAISSNAQLLANGSRSAPEAVNFGPKDAVAVSETEGFIVIQMRADAPDAAAGLGTIAGVVQNDPSILDSAPIRKVIDPPCRHIDPDI